MSPRTWARFAATWAVVFALPHLYWAAGPTTGLGTALSDKIVRNAGTGMQLGCAAIAVFCLCGAATALGTQVDWPPHRQRAARLALVVLTWFGAVLLVARSVDIYVEFGLNLTGAGPVPADQHENFLHLGRWFLFLWLPYFVLGAIAWTGLARSFTSYLARTVDSCASTPTSPRPPASFRSSPTSSPPATSRRRSTTSRGA